MSSPSTDESLHGVVLDGRFRIDRKLGEGGMGTVYLGTQLAVDRAVAIKLLHRASLVPESLRSRFFGEARTLAALSHRNIVSVIEFGEAQEVDALFLVMDHVDGVVLSELIDRGPLDWRYATRIAAQIVSGLTEAHHHGIVHRDLKPDNLMLTVSADGTVEPVILDFGIARDERSGKLTETGNIIGTPEYMAPEQASAGPITPATDFYSLGVILFEMLTGDVPFTGPSMAVLVAKVGQPAPPVAAWLAPGVAVPPALSRFVDQLLVQDPVQRPGEGNLVRDRLFEVLGDTDTTLLASPHGPDPFATWFGGAETAPLPRLPVPERALTTPGPPARPTPRAAPTMSESPVAADVSSVPPPPALSLSKRELVVGIVAALATCAVVVGTLTLVSEDEADRRPVGEQSEPLPEGGPPAVEREPVGVVAPPSPMTVDSGASKHPARPTEQREVGCGKVYDTEYPVRGGTLFERRRRHWSAALPRDYDPTRPHPIVLLFHKNASHGSSAIGVRGMDELADEKKLVVISPETPYHDRPFWSSTSSWTEPNVEDYVRRVVADAAELFCLDPSRIYAVGHGAGGRMVEKLACALPLSGAASSGHRFLHNEKVCSPRPTPFIHLWGKRDPYLPRTGGKSPCEVSIKVTLDAKLARWKDANGCGTEEPTRSRKRHGTCQAWNCEAPFSFCEVDGGHLWPGERKNAAQTQLSAFSPCVRLDVESRFDYVGAIWHFFETEGRALGSPEQGEWATARTDTTERFD